MATVFSKLKNRGFIESITNEEKIEEIFDKKQEIVCYTGFDPTGDSLHIGHLIPIIALKHIEDAGYSPIALLGGGTAMIGDPSGKTEMRKMITKDTIRKYSKNMREQIGKFLNVDKGKSKILNNAEWLEDLNYIDFLREIGSKFSVNRMLSAEAYKIRLERGLSFIEFNYQILQAYDFLTLFRKEGCIMQMGGNDQWGNILAGVDLIRRMEQQEVNAFTYPLLTTASGKKMGKTEDGAVWLDPDKFSPYKFFQYFRNVEDEDVFKLLKIFTFLPLGEIEKMKKWKNTKKINKAKEKLAFEATKFVHGKEEAKKALNSSRAVFEGNKKKAKAIPEFEVKEEEVKEEIRLRDLMADKGITDSKSKAKRLIKQGGVYVNDERIEHFAHSVDKSDFDEEGVLMLRVGKKKYYKLKLV
ncbi:MAG: tyrosine--tRNA ligase [Candidatus Mcinerneyibacterium aminivorans]|uniref:Tyrosine--tRNA ligase n=1 Tax=Candidatus Mcinerneyibacterium aminivorans TaxID=2703815 RepID=A0A5D0MFU4_9BACT|nr:MAG: tyrosine--tRNA ligase [Candidatus Mcinerneyibacterium aminivorans]